MADYQFRPLGDWQGQSTPAPKRRYAQFKVHYTQTLDQLFAEAGKLGAKHLVLQVDLSERDIRTTDGLPRSNARFGSHPGVVVSFDSKFGPLRYATDVFTTWKDNLRAIVLSLEALRAVDRYGVTKRGEQYTGWKALPASSGSTFGNADEAFEWMQKMAADLGAEATSPGALYSFLKRRLHPDVQDGDSVHWDRLDNARQLMAAAGTL